jgi:hypothetical protein
MIIFESFLRKTSWPEQFLDFHPECPGNEAAVFVRGHTAAQLDVRENVPRDVALQDLELGHQHVLRPPPLVTQPGDLPPDKIGIVPHIFWCP